MGSTAQAYLGDVAVLGLGRTGESAARYLASLVPLRARSVTLFGGAASAEGERTRALEGAGVRCVLGTEEVTGRYDLVVASPGIPVDSAFFRSAAACAAEVVGEPELAWRESPERWVAITGTNGKTTTTSLAAHLLGEAGLPAEAVGNIGTPPTEALPARPEGGWFVAELSSFQLATTRLLHPRVAVLLNITPDHLEWHHTMEAYAAAKERAFANLGAGDLAVVSVDDDALCRAAAARLEGRGLRVCRLSVHEEPAGPCAAFLRAGELVVRLDGAERALCRAADLKIVGLHNAENALAASAVALELGVSAADVARGLRSFSPIEHRLEPAGTVAGVRYVNDSKATNTDAVEKALTGFSPGSVGAAARRPRQDDRPLLARRRGCVGGAARPSASARRAPGSPAPSRARRTARRGGAGPRGRLRAPHLREGLRRGPPGSPARATSVLLSPACSSFDEFSNMAERGRRPLQAARGRARREGGLAWPPGARPAPAPRARRGAHGGGAQGLFGVPERFMRPRARLHRRHGRDLGLRPAHGLLRLLGHGARRLRGCGLLPQAPAALRCGWAWRSRSFSPGWTTTSGATGSSTSSGP